MQDVSEKYKGMSNAQLRAQLKKSTLIKQPLKDSLLTLLEHYYCLDSIARSTGLSEENNYFSSRVAWGASLQKIESGDEDELEKMQQQLASVSSQFDEDVISTLQKWRNRWMLQVMLFDLLVIALLTIVPAGLLYWQGAWQPQQLASQLSQLFYERPLFMFTVIFLLLAVFLFLHFSLRKMLAMQILKRLNNRVANFNLAKAFIKNTRIHHSIFRPDIVGYHRCLQRISALLLPAAK